MKRGWFISFGSRFLVRTLVNCSYLLVAPGNLMYNITCSRVSFQLLLDGGQNEFVRIIGGRKYVFVCKACGKLGGSGGILDLSLDAIWWNLGLFLHKYLLCHYKLYDWFTCKIAYPRGTSQSQEGANAQGHTWVLVVGLLYSKNCGLMCTQLTIIVSLQCWLLLWL